MTAPTPTPADGTPTGAVVSDARDELVASTGAQSSPGQGAWSPQRGEAFWYLGGKVRVLLTGEDTGGTLSVLEFTDPVGHAPPMHLHEREAETWTVLEGKVMVVVDGARHEIGQGEAVYSPLGTVHSYLVRSPSARLIATYVPAGIERHFIENGAPITEGSEEPAPFDIDAVATSINGYGVRLAGPPPTLED